MSSNYRPSMSGMTDGEQIKVLGDRLKHLESYNHAEHEKPAANVAMAAIRKRIRELGLRLGNLKRAELEEPKRKRGDQ